MNNKEWLGASKNAKKNNCYTCLWVFHVKEYAAKHNVPYWVAMRDPMCKQSYHKRKQNTK